MKVEKLQHVYYVVPDVTAAVAFYRDVLGFSLQFQDGTRWAQLDAGGVTLALASPEEGAVPPGGGGVVTFRVSDLAAALDAVKVAGAVPVGSIRDMGQHGKTVAVRDSAGNVFQLFQRS